jgi:hypothetical protein
MLIGEQIPTFRRIMMLSFSEAKQFKKKATRPSKPREPLTQGHSVLPPESSKIPIKR